MNNQPPILRTSLAAGFVLYVALVLVLVVGAVSAFFLHAAFRHGQSVRRWHEYDQCLLDAQSALEQVKYELVGAYRASPAGAAGALDWFQTWSLHSVGRDPAYTIPALAPINGSAVAVTIANVKIATNDGVVNVELIGAATRPAPHTVSRIIHETLQITASPGGAIQPFEYGYLRGNPGRLRDNMVINGDLRVNGDFRLNPKSVINGNRYASGQLTANSPAWSVTDYWKPANTTPAARPTDPTSSDNIPWPMGYVPSKVKNAFLPQFELPSVADPDRLAALANGQISRNGVTLVANIYAGPGPDNIAGTADDGCLVLDGTAQPLVIAGTVVIPGDVIIRGRITGQGRILAGRNVHIVGNLVYVNPPAWPKPDPNPIATAATNATRDLLILAGRGNVVIGNYTTATWSNRVWGILTDPTLVQPHNVSASDAAIGYDSDNNPANGYRFDGRYYEREANNGRRLSGSGTNTVPRRYYESSLADSVFSALCDANNVPAIHAALFANHGILGDLGSSAAGGNATLNGALAAQDELLNFYGLFTLNWDIRLSAASREQPRLNFAFGSTGRVAVAAATINWREVN